MGFLKSYLSLPRYQRVLIGLVGAGIGWYGPYLMDTLFLSNDVSVQIGGASSAHVTDPPERN
jgi:hypothetical protein